MKHSLSEKSVHKEFLLKALDWLSTIRSSGHSKIPPCLNGWKMAINCLLQLWDVLHNMYNVSYPHTNRLNQDIVENLFSIIRGKGGATKITQMHASFVPHSVKSW